MRVCPLRAARRDHSQTMVADHSLALFLLLCSMAAPLSAKDWQSVTTLLEKVAAEHDSSRRQRLAPQATTFIKGIDAQMAPMTAAACKQVTKKQVCGRCCCCVC